MNSDKNSFKITTNNITAEFDCTPEGYKVASVAQSGASANVTELAKNASEVIEGLTGERIPISSLVNDIVDKLKGG